MSAYALSSFLPAPVVSNGKDCCGETSEKVQNISQPLHNNHDSQRQTKTSDNGVNVIINSFSIDPRSFTLDLARKGRRSSGRICGKSVIFHLSVTPNGRKYLANRSLHRFSKLRVELLNECKRTGRDQTIPIIPTSPCDDGYFSLSKSSTNEAFVASQSSSSGMGFTMLQTAFRRYTPELEDWIGYICGCMNTSCALSKFLWEPVHTGDCPTGRLGAICEVFDDESDTASIYESLEDIHSADNAIQMFRLETCSERPTPGLPLQSAW